MQNTDNELSNRTASLFSWLEFIGIALIIPGSTLPKQWDWLLLLALGLLSSGFIYRTIVDWRRGKRKIAIVRLIVLVIIFIIAVIVGLKAANR